MTTVGRGASLAVLKTEPTAAVVAASAGAEAAEVAAVTTERADNNQQRAEKMVTVTISVDERCQTRGEKRWRQGGQWRWRRQRWPVGRSQR